MLGTQQLTDLITCDPEIVSGTPVFTGTRVPIKNLFDYLKGGHDLAEFLEDFPSVREGGTGEKCTRSGQRHFVYTTRR